jgi:hypothetical protein
MKATYKGQIFGEFFYTETVEYEKNIELYLGMFWPIKNFEINLTGLEFLINIMRMRSCNDAV